MPGRRIFLLLCAALSACSSQHAGSGDPSGADLSNTAWQLVEIQSTASGKTPVTDPSKYTLSFDESGSVAARIDCNRATGKWKTTPGGGLELGPLAVTRAMCEPDSLFNRVSRDLELAQSYRVENGRLQLRFKKGGDVYVFEPLPDSES